MDLRKIGILFIAVVGIGISVPVYAQVKKTAKTKSYVPVGKRSACKVRRSCKPGTARKGPLQVSETVTLTFTDEINGRSHTYQKVFKLSHIAPKDREKYIDQLMESYLTDAEEEGFTVLERSKWR